MTQKAIATIYNRHYIGENSFVFTCNYPTIGDYDEATNMFTDNSGNTFLPITSPYLMSKETPVGFFNLITIETIAKNIGENLTIEEAISNYEKMSKKIFYYVGKVPDGDCFCIPLDTDKITRDTTEEFLRIKKDKTNTERAIEEQEGLEEDEDDDLTEEEKEDIDNHYNHGEMHPALMELIMNIMNGEYSKEELQELKKQIQSDLDDMAEVLSTIDFQEIADETDEEAVLPASSKIENFGSKDKNNRKVRTTEEHYESEREDRINIDDLFSKVTKTLIAQDEPARRVITEIARKEMDERKKRRGILLTGQTGVGKTELMRLIAKYINRPFIEIDSTQLTIPGWVGRDIEEYLWTLYEECGEDIDKVEHAIIYFDEIDKKGSEKKDDHSKKGVLDVLLKFMDGTSYDACEDTKHSSKKVKINTSKMIKILGGAYTDVYKLTNSRLVGFEQKEKDSYSPEVKDFVEKGLMTEELMGRLDIIKLNDLDEESIKQIMLLSDESALKIQEAIFNKLGVKITFTDSYITGVAKQAVARKTGARGLDTVIDNTTWQAFAKVYTSQGEYDEVIIDEKTLEDASNYQLVKKKKAGVSKN